MSVNLALNKPSNASSVENNYYLYSSSYSFDGNLSTRWSSAQNSDPQWIYVDLGGSYNINEVKLTWEAAYGKAYQIQVSNDATNWTTIYSTTNGAGGVNDITGLLGVGRYVRMYGTQHSTPSWGYSLWEFEVYGTAAQGGIQWGWKENFKTPAIVPWAKSYNIYACNNTDLFFGVVQSSPLGVIPPTPSGFYGLFTGPDASGYRQMVSTSFGQQLDPGADFVVPPYPPYPGVFTQSVKFYYPGSTGKGAWLPQPDQTTIAFQFGSDPNEDIGGDYALETNINFSVMAATPNQLDLTFSYGAFELYIYHAKLGNHPSLTVPGWYTINQTYMKTGNMTTDGGLCIIGMYDSSGNLVTYYLLPGGAKDQGIVPIVTSITDNYSGNHLQGPSTMLFYEFQAGFAGGMLALADIGWYLGHPSISRPSILNGYQQTATHGQPFSLQITAPGATSYSAVGLATGLSLNATTGLISGTPTVVG